MPFMQPQFIIFILMLTLGQCITSKLVDQEDDRVIIIDQDGTSDFECCTYGRCHCSNLSLALEHTEENTEIRIQSDISLHNTVLFGYVSNVTITGDGNPTVRCDHQGGLVARNVGYIVIQGVTWDSCDEGIEINGSINAQIIKCNFQNILFSNSALILRGYGSMYINNSVFFNVDDRGVYLNIDSYDASAISSIIVCNSTFNNATLVIASNDNKRFHSDAVLNVTIKDCNFSNNTYYGMHCKGMDHLLPTISMVSSTFTNNLDFAVKADKCGITLQNCSFLNNRKSAVNISYGSINMTGPVLFHDNVVYSAVDSYGGAISLLNSNMSVSKGPIKFYGNVADYGGVIYISKKANIYINNITDLELYNNSARYYGGAFYIESSLCGDENSISYYYDLLVDARYAASNTAVFGGNFVYFNVHDVMHCNAPNMPYKNGNLFATQPCSMVSEHEVEVHGNLTDDSDSFKFWLHDLHFNLIITDCIGNLFGPVQVLICCDDKCDNIYEYIVDSTHNNTTMISNDTFVSCPISESHIFKLNVSANDYSAHDISVSTQINVQFIILSFDEVVENCKDIAHVFIYYNNSPKCIVLSCYLQDISLLPEGVQCTGSSNYSYFYILPGYWFENGFTKFVDNCPQGHCNNILDLYESILLFQPNVTFPNEDSQCAANWTGLACAECNKDNFIIHDSTDCVPSHKCYLMMTYGIILFFLISLFYWIIVISLIFVLLHFKSDITVGYAYGVIFFYGILEQTVNASYFGTHNNLNYPVITTLLLVLSSIGNMKPPLILLKLCFWESVEMIDHMFLSYLHPVIVTCLIVIIFISARNSVTVARTIGRFVNSKSICILLLFSYNSVSYTSLQLLKPLAVYKRDVYYNTYYTWHSYLSPTLKYFDHRHVVYCMIAILCKLSIGFGFPLILLLQRYLTRYFNINFTSIKPVMDQLKGCYKEEYRWFAAYYLLCRQVICIADISVDFISNSKFPIMLTVYFLIMMVHVWLQPYKQRKLNILDSFILMILVLVFICEHISYGSTRVAWVVPLVLFINVITLSSRLKYILMPISCLIIIGLSILFSLLYYANNASSQRNFNISTEDSISIYIYWLMILIPGFVFFVYLIYVLKHLCLFVIKKCYRTDYRVINEQNVNHHDNSDSNEEI